MFSFLVNNMTTILACFVCLATLFSYLVIGIVVWVLFEAYRDAHYPQFSGAYYTTTEIVSILFWPLVALYIIIASIVRDAVTVIKNQINKKNYPRE